MATSGSTDFTLTRDQIIEAAARKIQAIRAGATMSSGMRGDFAQALNAMVKRWQSSGIHVWAVEEGVLFPTINTAKYTIGPSGTAKVTLEESYISTQTAADAVVGASTLTVDSITGIANGDNIGITLDDGTLQWTTVNGAPSGTTVTLTAVLTDSVATDNYIYTYTTGITDRPLKIVDARRFDPTGSIDTPITPMARLEYRQQPQKLTTGAINQFYYDPQTPNGNLFLWPVVTTVSELVKFTWHRPLEDFDSAGNNPDLPQEWIDTLIFNLAVVMAPEFEVPQEVMAGPYGVGTLADKFLDQLTGFDREHESISFGIDFEG